VPDLSNLASPIMRTAAGFHAVRAPTGSPCPSHGDWWVRMTRWPRHSLPFAVWSPTSCAAGLLRSHSLRNIIKCWETHLCLRRGLGRRATVRAISPR
jgi:hypothetical protein